MRAAVLKSTEDVIPAEKEIRDFLRRGYIQCQARRNGSGDIENVGREQWGGLRLCSLEGRDIAVPVNSEADPLPLARSLTDYLSGSVPASDTPAVWVDLEFCAEQAMRLWPLLESNEFSESPNARVRAQGGRHADLPRPARLSLHDTIGYVAERCGHDLIKAGKAVFYALGDEALIAHANVLNKYRTLGSFGHLDDDPQPVPVQVWAGYPWPWFERRAVLPRGNPQYREHTPEGRDIGPVFDSPTIGTVDIDAWLGGGVRPNPDPMGDKHQAQKHPRAAYAGPLAEWMARKGVALLRRMTPSDVASDFKAYCETERPRLLRLLPKRLRSLEPAIERIRMEMEAVTAAADGKKTDDKGQ
jgi:hypothetical protein